MGPMNQPPQQPGLMPISPMPPSMVPPPGTAPAPAPFAPSPSAPQAAGMVGSMGGVLSMEGQSSIDARAQRKADAEEANNQPVIQGLVGHVRACWTAAMAAKRITVEERMLKAMRQRRGEYDPEILAEIKKGGGSEIYMLLTSNKCRAAASWIRDVMFGTRDEKPWTIEPTPLPDLPPQIAQSVAALAAQEGQQYEQQTGQQVQPQDMEKIVAYVKDRIVANAKKRAQEACDRMELKMEDQLVEGGFQRALGDFIEDIVTFPSAFIKGPVVRNKKKLKWVPDPKDPKNYTAVVEDKLTLEWNRVDPFMGYPAPFSTDVDDGYFIERHKLTRPNLNELIGVEGYKEDAIRAVLEEFGKGGLTSGCTSTQPKPSSKVKVWPPSTSLPRAPSTPCSFGAVCRERCWWSGEWMRNLSQTTRRIISARCGSLTAG